MEIKRENPASRQTRIAAFVRKNTVLLIALVLAVLSIALVPPDEAYAGYYDLKTLCCLFGTLAVVCALKNIHFFSILAQRIIVLTGSERTAALALVYITFIGSMLIANDMALITFLPLGYFVFSVTDSKRDMAVVFILQNIAANLGGMLTPFGNPQNLYLYAHTITLQTVSLYPSCFRPLRYPLRSLRSAACCCPSARCAFRPVSRGRACACRLRARPFILRCLR